MDKQKCIIALQRATKELGHPPTVSEWRDGCWSPSAKTISKTVGSWNEAKDAAGLHFFEQGQTRAKQKQRYGPDISFGTKPKGYERVAAGDSTLYVHRLLAVAEFGFDEVAENVVHHKSGVPWDNRPENIEVMDRAEHQSFHMADR